MKWSCLPTSLRAICCFDRYLLIQIISYSESLLQPVCDAKWKSNLLYSTLRRFILTLKSHNVKVLFQMRVSVDINPLKQMSFIIVAPCEVIHTRTGVCCNTSITKFIWVCLSHTRCFCTVVSTWIYHKLSVILGLIIAKLSFQQLSHLCNLMF